MIILISGFASIYLISHFHRVQFDRAGKWWKVRVVWHCEPFDEHVLTTCSSRGSCCCSTQPRSSQCSFSLLARNKQTLSGLVRIK
uniref:Uncharacterized protein n=1 Tax=Amphimedon queenslandica TaxID=400682 RepID=A0A1X7VCH1_AMPQE